ncbi:MAG: hypothetical protein KC592_09595 [Nitrospira sp.]|nr:hypothetical protein [Nitrospira sp.]
MEYDKRLDDIADAWERLSRTSIGSPRGIGSTALPDPQVALIQDFYDQVEKLIKDHKATRAKTDTIAERLFQANRPENRHLGDTLRPVLRRWIKLREWFVGHAHDNGRTDAEYDWEDIKRKFILFERTVLTIGQGFFVTIADLDELIRNSTPANVHLVLAQLGHIEHYRYFFEHIEDPAWIPALKTEGIFRTPPPVEGTLNPRWAASEFLVRVADRAELKEVMNALTDIADALAQQTVPNPLIVRDLVDALFKLPAEHSIPFVPKFKKWASQEDGIFFWRRLGKLTVHLAEGGKSEEGLALLSALLAVERAQPNGEQEYLFRLVKPRIRIHDYCRIVEKDLPPVYERSGPELFDNLCSILQRAAKFSRRSRSSNEWDDNFIAWQPDLSFHDEDDREDVRSVLAVTTLNIVESLLRDGRAEITSVVEDLEARRWLIFRRLALYILANTTLAQRDMIASRLTHEPTFREGNIQREYNKLLHVGFGCLTPDEQQIILNWVEAGPENVEQLIENYIARTGQRPSPEDIEKHRLRWQWKRLWPCHTELPPNWRKRYDALIEEFGEFESLPRPMREASLIAGGEREPRTKDELRTFTAEALREYLLTWTPDRTSFPYPTRSGLAVVLTSLVEANPVLYANTSSKWRGLDPTYLHGIVRGFVKALQSDRPFAWEPVLSLCSWILDQPHIVPEQSFDRWEADPDWGGTRWWIVELLRVGFQHETFGIPIELREIVWRLLETLTLDPDPEMDKEEEDFNRPSHSMHRAINSVRGRAIEGILFYPNWIKVQTGEVGPARLPSEAREVLEKHLDQTRDPSLAIRSLYGRWLPWLLVFDRGWGISAVSRIFPHDDEPYWLAAWNGFICFNDAYEEVFQPLQPVYAQAITQLGRPTEEEDETRSIREERLSCHLMTFYWRGHYLLEEETGLLHLFFTEAPDKIRAKAHEFIGRSLANTPDPIESVALNRVQILWEWRIEQARLNPISHQAELRAFGWLFSASKFGVRWAVDNLLSVLRLTKTIDPDDQVVECLPDYSARFPIEVLDCVRLLIEGQNSSIELSCWGEDLRRIFSQTRQHPEFQVRQTSDAVIELLGRLGHLDYRDLLTDTPS